MKSTKGFETPPLSIISSLRSNLRDRYQSGFPILKELIQNADDAGAKVLHLGWSEGLSGVDDHPLLKGRAIFVINDGTFDEDNATAIRQIGLSSKSGDQATIGKFGLSRF